uniref:Major facilitator superfamily (MFS) profile domain-containing protein n=1 Tax=Aplanochytrium stocchinoi TaxID=215587 RepID=A0A7S3PII3_9STRA
MIGEGGTSTNDVDSRTIEDDERDASFPLVGINQASSAGNRHGLENSVLPGSALEEVGRILDDLGDSWRLKMYALLLGFGNAADAIEISSFAYIITVFKNPNTGSPISDDAFWSGLLTSAIYSGMLVGGLLSGYFGDRIGRRPALVSSMALNSVGAISSSLTPKLPNHAQLPWLLMCRLSAGLGVGGTIPSVFTLIAEISPSNQRGFYVNVVAWFWCVGLFATAVVARAFLYDSQAKESLPDQWPMFAVVAGLPAGICSILVKLFMVESPRFLTLKQRYQEAAASLLRMSGNPKNDSLLLDRIERLSVQTPSIIQKSLGLDFREGVRTILSPSLFRYTFILCLIWFLLSFSGYGISSWIGELFKKVGFEDPYAASILYASASVPGNIFATALIERLERRKLLTYSLALGAFSAFLFVFSTNSKMLVLITVCLYQACVTSSWNTVDAITSESFPSGKQKRSYIFLLITSILDL